MRRGKLEMVELRTNYVYRAIITVREQPGYLGGANSTGKVTKTDDHSDGEQFSVW
jgi:hypothetical protein